MCSFKGSDSWVILSPIELSIKRKIEAVGTPLKDWDINIYRGVLTGCNDAFIIPGEKRQEILDNCLTAEERKRTAELIRPILRGRDIKRYHAEFADLWLIATFPSRKYDIEDYPAVKQYLLDFGKERLEQTGATHIVRGESIKSRKKTNNKWFETQDSISYWEDFSKPKVVYPETTQGSYFYFDDGGHYIDKTCFMIVGNDAMYLSVILSSKLLTIAYKKIFSSIELGENGYQYNKHALIKLPILILSPENKNKFIKLGQEILIKKEMKSSTIKEEDIIDQMTYALYGLNQREMEFIANYNPIH